MRRLSTARPLVVGQLAAGLRVSGDSLTSECRFIRLFPFPVPVLDSGSVVSSVAVIASGWKQPGREHYTIEQHTTVTRNDDYALNIPGVSQVEHTRRWAREAWQGFGAVSDMVHEDLSPA